MCSFCFNWVPSTAKFSPWWFHSLLILLQDFWGTLAGICRRQKHDQREEGKGLTLCVCLETGHGRLSELVLVGPTYEVVYNLELDDDCRKNMTLYPTAWYGGKKTDPNQLWRVYLTISNVAFLFFVCRLWALDWFFRITSSFKISNFMSYFSSIYLIVLCVLNY